MNSADFLDLMRAKKGLTSDNKVAQLMEIPQGHISQYRTGAREFSDKVAVQFAKALELPPSYVMAEIQATRAKDSTVKIIWQNLAKTIKKTHAFAIVALIAFGAFSVSHPVEAAGLSKPADNIHYAHMLTLLALHSNQHLKRYLQFPTIPSA